MLIVRLVAVAIGQREASSSQAFGCSSLYINKSPIDLIFFDLCCSSMDSSCRSQYQGLSRIRSPSLVSELTAGAPFVAGELSGGGPVRRDLFTVARSHLDLKFEHRMKTLGRALESRFVAIDARFVAFDARFVAFDEKIDARFDRLESRLSEFQAQIEMAIVIRNRWGIDAADRLLQAPSLISDDRQSSASQIGASPPSLPVAKEIVAMPKTSKERSEDGNSSKSIPQISRSTTRSFSAQLPAIGHAADVAVLNKKARNLAGNGSFMKDCILELKPKVVTRTKPELAVEIRLDTAEEMKEFLSCDPEGAEGRRSLEEKIRCRLINLPRRKSGNFTRELTFDSLMHEWPLLGTSKKKKTGFERITTESLTCLMEVPNGQKDIMKEEAALNAHQQFDELLQRDQRQNVADDPHVEDQVLKVGIQESSPIFISPSINLAAGDVSKPRIASFAYTYPNPSSSLTKTDQLEVDRVQDDGSWPNARTTVKEKKKRQRKKWLNSQRTELFRVEDYLPFDLDGALGRKKLEGQMEVMMNNLHSQKRCLSIDSSFDPMMYTWPLLEKSKKGETHVGVLNEAVFEEEEEEGVDDYNGVVEKEWDKSADNFVLETESVVAIKLLTREDSGDHGFIAEVEMYSRLTLELVGASKIIVVFHCIQRLSSTLAIILHSKLKITFDPGGAKVKGYLEEIVANKFDEAAVSDRSTENVTDYFPRVKNPNSLRKSIPFDPGGRDERNEDEVSFWIKAAVFERVQKLGFKYTCVAVRSQCTCRWRLDFIMKFLSWILRGDTIEKMKVLMINLGLGTVPFQNMAKERGGCLQDFTTMEYPFEVGEYVQIHWFSLMGSLRTICFLIDMVLVTFWSADGWVADWVKEDKDIAYRQRLGFKIEFLFWVLTTMIKQHEEDEYYTEGTLKLGSYADLCSDPNLRASVDVGAVDWDASMNHYAQQSIWQTLLKVKHDSKRLIFDPGIKRELQLWNPIDASCKEKSLNRVPRKMPWRSQEDFESMIRTRDERMFFDLEDKVNSPRVMQ